MKATRICVADDCEKPAHARGLCGAHYMRSRRIYGAVAPTDRAVLVDRFWKKVRRAGDGECWPWLGSVDDKGYGRFAVDGRSTYAHRFACEITGREIPDGLVVDHLCRNKGCVNPAHLDVVTTAENTRRGLKSYALRPRCKNGHDITDPGNVYTTPDGRHACRECRSMAMARYLARQGRRSARATGPLAIHRPWEGWWK